ncbi:hypothetical protein KAR91_48955 [Candidatus Pacearchaeota archaeon]|nr:hypothetical protein [Candidatus Pacearchaeota archaeon]
MKIKSIAGIDNMDNIDNFLMDLNAIINDHCIDKIDISVQFGVSETRIKPAGNIACGRIIDKLCRCGCRLKTDGDYIWCSSPTCGVFKGK